MLEAPAELTVVPLAADGGEPVVRRWAIGSSADGLGGIACGEAGGTGGVCAAEDRAGGEVASALAAVLRAWRGGGNGSSRTATLLVAEGSPKSGEGCCPSCHHKAFTITRDDSAMAAIVPIIATGQRRKALKPSCASIISRPPISARPATDSLPAVAPALDRAADFPWPCIRAPDAVARRAREGADERRTASTLERARASRTAVYLSVKLSFRWRSTYRSCRTGVR